MKVFLSGLMLLCWMACPGVVSALVPVPLGDTDERVLDARHMEYLADPAARLTIEDIGVLSRFNTLAWLPGQQQVLNFGLSDSVYWVRFSLENNTTRRLRLFLELDNAALDQVQFYYQGNTQGYTRVDSGEAVPFASREIAHRNFVLPLLLEASERQTVYLRINSTGRLYLPLIIRSEAGWFKAFLGEYIAWGVYFSTLLLLALVLLLAYGITRTTQYLYYLGYVFSITLFSAADSGIAAQYLYPGKPLLANMVTPASVVAAVIFGVLLTRLFLRTARLSPLVDGLLRRAIPVALLVLPLLLLGYYAMAAYLLQVLIAVVLLLGVCAALKAVRDRGVSAYLYLGAMLALTAGLAVEALLAYDWLNYGIGRRWGLYLGICLQLAFFVAASGLLLHRLRLGKELAQEEAIGQLQQLDRIKDEFLANISHELRTPLNGIIGLSRTLLSGLSGRLDAEQSRTQQLIVQSAQRLARLVDDILDYSQLRDGTLRVEMQAVDLNYALESVIGVVRPLAAQKDIVIRNQVGGETIWIRADESRLHQVLYNLLGNAIKFTEGGVITLTAVVHNGEVFVSVIDTGAGIPPNELNHIFEPFRQGDGSIARAHAGAGLGLSITRMLVELLGGRIEVNSRTAATHDDTADTGTTVTFVLPEASPQEVYDKNRPDRPRSTPTVPALAGIDTATSTVHELRKHLERSAPSLLTESDERTYTILAVDDDPINLKVLETILLGSGLRLVTSSSGQEVMSLVEEEEPDLILLDLMMPGLSGYEICSELRKRYDAVELPVVMVTARTQTVDLVHAYESGANDYITKPFDGDELLARVHSHLHIKKLVHTLKENEQLREEIKLRRRAEYSLQVSQSRLTELLDLDESAILCFDHRDQAVYFNKGACSLFGYANASLQGLGLQDLFVEPLAQMQEDDVLTAEEQGRVRMVLKCRHRDGHIFEGDAVINPLDVDGAGGLAVVLYPYTEHPAVDMQESLKKRESQLQAVEQSINSILEIARHNPQLIPQMRSIDSVDETQHGLAGNKQHLRAQCVTVMGLALACWEHETGKGKIDLAEDSMIWPVYIDKSTPTTRTLDKYLHLNTIPKNPRAQRVIDTAAFVLRKCPAASASRKELELALNNLRMLLSGKAPG